MKKFLQDKPGLAKSLSVAFVITALVTLITFTGAEEPNMISFKSLCSFAPISTFICLYIAWFIRFLSKGRLKN